MIYWSQLDQCLSFWLQNQRLIHEGDKSVISIFIDLEEGQRSKFPVETESGAQGQYSLMVIERIWMWPSRWRSRVSRRLGRPSEGLYKASCVIIIWQAWRIWDQNTRKHQTELLPDVSDVDRLRLNNPQLMKWCFHCDEASKSDLIIWKKIFDLLS